MKTIETITELKQLREEWARTGARIGFVPTMGALHAGHLSLFERARRDSTHVVASIFVNPTQFNDPKDYETYPQPLERDLELLQKQGVDAVFLPRAQEIYQDDFQFSVQHKSADDILCGPHRPGHFAGVLTVVLKLFHLVRPHRAYFGEKDYQQLRLIQEMSKALFLDIEVIPCETVREADGLAMSSRNLRLTPEERRRAPQVHEAITTARTPQEAAERLSQAGFQVEYVEEHWGRRFVAAHLGSVRLIDNVQI